MKPDSKTYQAPSRHVMYALQKLFNEEIKQLDIIMPLGMDETAECCNSFILVPKVNGKVRLYLDPARLKQTLMHPVPRSATLNDMFP